MKWLWKEFPFAELRQFCLLPVVFGEQKILKVEALSENFPLKNWRPSKIRFSLACSVALQNRTKLATFIASRLFFDIFDIWSFPQFPLSAENIYVPRCLWARTVETAYDLRYACVQGSNKNWTRAMSKSKKYVKKLFTKQYELNESILNVHWSTYNRIRQNAMCLTAKCYTRFRHRPAFSSARPQAWKTFIIRLVPPASSVNSRHFCSAEPSNVNCRPLLVDRNFWHFIFQIFLFAAVFFIFAILAVVIRGQL